MKKRVFALSELPEESRFEPGQHNYIRLFSLVPKRIFAPGTVSVCDVEHDDGCAVYDFRICTCRPNITIRDSLTHEVRFSLRWRGDEIVIHEEE